MTERIPDDAPRVRRMPEQARSRARVERVLDAAAELIARQGYDATSMSDIADEAGVRLPSVYRYFPSKQAVLATLAERYRDRVREQVTGAIHDVDSYEAAHAQIEAGVRGYWDLWRADATVASIWTAVMAMPEMVAEDMSDSRQTGEVLAAVFAPVLPDDLGADPAIVGYLISHLVPVAIRLATQLDPDDGEAVVKLMTERMIPAMLGIPLRSAPGDAQH